MRDLRSRAAVFPVALFFYLFFEKFISRSSSQESRLMSTLKSSQTLAPVALITGGGSGIGAATAKKFLSEGWRVILVGRNRDRLLSVSHEIQENVSIRVCDISDADQTQKLARELLDSSSPEKLGQNLKALIHNAGIYERSSLSESTDKHWEKMFAINFFGPVRLTRDLMPLLESTKGVVINVSSTLGLRPIPETGAYSASKAAMISWTQTLALEFAKSGVRANAICPGIIDTPIHPFHNQSESEKLQTLGSLQPLGRIGRPEDVAHAIWSLCAPGSEWITGTTLTVDGGINLV